MIGTDPGRDSCAKREAMAIIAARPFFISTSSYRAIFSGEAFFFTPRKSKFKSPGVLVDFPRQLSPVCPTLSPSAMAMKPRIPKNKAGCSAAKTPRAFVQSGSSGKPSKCIPNPKPPYDTRIGAWEQRK